ncbi:MAG TPA: ribonuclease D [Gemmatimonadetes bacterium]|nr:ribonuclease D [Gemmatimonadota bacterium]
MSYTHIESERDVGALIADLNSAKRITLDCEAAGFHRYSDRICLVQLSTADATYVIDPLAFDPSDVLRDVVEDPLREVVMHGADFDLRLLHRDLGLDLHGLFDTQIAASLLGLETLGLASLLGERFGVTLSKKYQRADWAERPLTEGMLDYAASDTIYLLALRDQLVEELTEAGRLAWVEEECRALEQSATMRKDGAAPRDPVTRVKGARHLSPRQVTALREALSWRDEVARERDKAPFRIVGDGPLIDAVALHPRRAEELTSIKGFPRGLAKGEGRQLVSRLHAVVAIPEEELAPYPRKGGGGPGHPPPEVEELAEKLKAARNKAADELGLARGTLLSNAVLVEVARAAPEDTEALAAVGGMRRWRMHVLGDDLLAVIRKR